MSYFVAGAMVTSSVIEAGAGIRAGRKAYENGLIQQAMNEVAAGQTIAAGQRAALEDTRQAELIASRALVIGAAQGGAGDLDRLTADIMKEGEYRANVSLYEAETEAEAIKYQGKQAAARGKDAMDAGYNDALTTVISGGMNAYAYQAGAKKKSGKNDWTKKPTANKPYSSSYGDRG